MRTIRDIDVRGKRVLVRVDFNVPLDPQTGDIADDSRIQASLPTIEYLIVQGAKVILCAHLGRPSGQVVEALCLAPIASRLTQLLGRPVNALQESSGSDVERATGRLKPGELAMLENIRFQPGEEKNDPILARDLAHLADIFVNDGFGVSHRTHASTVGVARLLPSVAGFVLEKEVSALSHVLHDPAHPFVTILGGAKVRDKIGVLDNLLQGVDKLLIGGGMAATFLQARGIAVGTSRIETDRLDSARDIMERAQASGVGLFLPQDAVVAPDPSDSTGATTVAVGDITNSVAICDIGPVTTRTFASELQGCKTALWNGPMGIFETEAFSHGTRSIAGALATLNASTIVGGGSTAEAVIELGLAGKMGHVSTGGGASLEFLEGRSLPGIEVLKP